MPRTYIKNFIKITTELSSLPFLFLFSLISRCIEKKIDVGIGPFPIVTHGYFKKALALHNYTARTFVDDIYYITADFDLRSDLIFKGRLSIFRKYYLFIYSIFHFKCLYIYFHGGALHSSIILWKIEPLLYKLAGVKIVVMPYGGDVQDMTRTNNLLFKHAISKDYPGNKNKRRVISKKIDLWTRHANHVIGGCDWVDYLYHWDSLCLAHFCLDTDAVDDVARNTMPKRNSESLVIFHAPNHTNIKGTAQLIRAIEELRSEGYNIELKMRQKVNNKEILIEISKSDLVVDQLIIGWYGMFALEAMAQEKPVICYIRDDLENLYISSGLLEKDELPIIKSSISTIKETLTKILHETINLEAVREKSKEFVRRHHSVTAIGHMFNEINKKIL